MLRRKKKGKSKVLAGRFCVRDSEGEQRALKLLHIYCSIANSYSSAPESSKQNPRERILDLHFFFHHKHIASLKNHLSLAKGESLPYWLRGNFCGHVCFDLLVERIYAVCSH